MTHHETLDVAAANVLMVMVGVGLLPALRLAQTRRELLTKLPLAYAVGIAATGILATELGIIGIPFSPLALLVASVLAFAFGLWRVRPGTAPNWRSRPNLRSLPVIVVFAAIGAFLANALRLLAVKPIVENDGWAIWGTRARALYEFGTPGSPVFTSHPYFGLQYPLLLPELEAINFRFMGATDGTVMHLQLLGLAAALVGAAWTLLRPYVSPLLLAVTLLAVMVAPAFWIQLESASADIPMAIFIALGVTTLALWLRSGDPGLLPTATLFLVAGAMTKNEGELFALAALVTGFATGIAARRRPLAIASAAWLVLVAPWHVWLRAHGVSGTNWDLGRLLHPSYLASHLNRPPSAARQLLAHVWQTPVWSYLPVFTAAGIVGAILLRRHRDAAFAACWAVLSFAGLLCVYWASPFPLHPDLYNSADRTIDALLLTGVLLVPVLIGRSPPAVRSAPPQQL